MHIDSYWTWRCLFANPNQSQLLNLLWIIRNIKLQISPNLFAVQNDKACSSKILLICRRLLPYLTTLPVDKVLLITRIFCIAQWWQQYRQTCFIFVETTVGTPIGFPYIEMSAETSTDTIHLVSYACVTYLNLIKSWTDNRNNAIHCFLAISGSRLLPVQLFLYVMDVFPLGKLLHCFLGHKIESDQGPHSSRQSEEFHDLIWASDRQISQSSDFPSLYQRFYS